MWRVAQPSLRNYAVIRQESRRPTFRIWVITDRRVELSEQFLLVPARWVAWPRLLARFNSLNPSVVRLRDGRVALQFPIEVHIHQINELVGKKHSRVELDALQGFLNARKLSLRLRLIAPTLISSLVIALALQATPNATKSELPLTVSKSKIRDTECSVTPRVGDLIPLTRKRSSQIMILNARFEFSIQASMGGLYRIILSRECDAEHFKLEAWRTGNYITVSKVN
jgi:hypothetical protein